MEGEIAALRFHGRSTVTADVRPALVTAKAEASPEMPAFVQFLAGILLVLPGGAMWSLGLLSLFIHSCSIPATILHGSAGRMDVLGFAYVAGFSILILLIGYSMMAAFDLLTTKQRYNIPAKHVVPCMGMELLVQILGVVSFAVTVAALASFWNLNGTSPWLAALVFLAGFSGCTGAIWIHGGNLARRKRWRAAHAASLPPM